MHTPSFSRERLKALVHYVCKKCSDPTKLGAVKLHKILWYSDGTSYVRLGQPITGETYIKHQFGPFAQDLDAVVAELVAERRLYVRDVEHCGHQKREYIAKGDIDASFLSETERRIVDQTIRNVCEDHTAGSISEKSHDVVWEMARMFEPIPYEALVATFLPVGDGDVAWAKAELERRGE